MWSNDDWNISKRYSFGKVRALLTVYISRSFKHLPTSALEGGARDFTSPTRNFREFFKPG